MVIAKIKINDLSDLVNIRHLIYYSIEPDNLFRIENRCEEITNPDDVNDKDVIVIIYANQAEEITPADARKLLQQQDLPMGYDIKPPNYTTNIDIKKIWDNKGGK